ncbi:MAG: hypothetical protein HRU31_10130 [Rhodobacteraceae bacterium]|nr:hypothetical protein [Paracoccaceae bacterium]
MQPTFGLSDEVALTNRLAQPFRRQRLDPALVSRVLACFDLICLTLVGWFAAYAA